MAPISLDTHVWLYIEIGCDVTHKYLYIDDASKELRVRAPEGDWLPLPAKQVEKMQQENEDATPPRQLVLGNGYPAWKYLHVMSAENSHLYCGSINMAENLIVKPFDIRTMVVTVTYSTNWVSKEITFVCAAMSGNVICVVTKSFDQKIYVRELIEEVRFHLADELAPSYRVSLVNKDGQVLMPFMPLFTPEQKTFKVIPARKILKKTPVAHLALAKKLPSP